MFQMQLDKTMIPLHAVHAVTRLETGM